MKYVCDVSNYMDMLKEAYFNIENKIAKKNVILHILLKIKINRVKSKVGHLG